MAQLRLYYPVRVPGNVGAPVLNQGFGVNEAYYSKFHDFSGQPLKGHDGLDFQASHGRPVYAAHDGFIHYEKDAHGGEGVVIRTTAQFEYRGTPAYFRSIYWHLIGDTDRTYPSPIPLDGHEYPVKAGDLIGYADNSGAPYESSGDHLHFGLFPSTGPNGDTFAEFDAHQALCEPHNGENGRIDPTPYFTGIYADVVKQEISLWQKVVGLYQQIVVLAKQKLSGALNSGSGGIGTADLVQPSNPPPRPDPDALGSPWSDTVIAHHNVRALCDLEGLTGTQVIDGAAWFKKDILTACVYQESQFRVRAIHRNTVIETDGSRRVVSTDWGIVQVNDVYHIGPGKDFPSVDYVLANPEASVRWMCQYYKLHGDLNAWCSYTSGAYKKWLGKV